MAYGLETVCVQGDQKKNSNYGAVSIPIFQTASFAHPALGESTGYDYTRVSNPTRDALEITVAKLEGGISALGFSSGMAAIDGFMQLFKVGDHIIAGSDLYGGTPRLFENIS
ncbi:MAG: PLP-dependent transferase, partial [Anaerotignaceae bacterium]